MASRKENDSSRELRRERKALRAEVFLSELKLRPPEERERFLLELEPACLAGPPRRAASDP
jgi:hypothetical protein